MVYDGDESTTWINGLTSVPYNEPGYQRRDGLTQWGYNTNVKIILDKEAIVTGVQIINKVDKKDFPENYKMMSLQFSNGYSQEIQLANGKQNDVSKLDNPVKTSFVNVVGLSTWGHHDENPWPPKWQTGYRSGLAEIRVFGCSGGNFSLKYLSYSNLSVKLLEAKFSITCYF